MKKYAFLALILLVGWSCQKDQEQLTPVDPVPEVEDVALTATSLSVNQALNNLAFVYRDFDGKTQVAKRIRKVDVITRRDLNASSTRGLTRSDIEEEAPLLYVINYENNEGFALLGADVQVPPIISIGDEGNFATQEYLDFVNSGTEEVFTDSGDDTNVQNLQFAMVSNAIQPSSVIFPPVNPGITIPIYEYSDTTILVKSWPLLKTKWGQGNPYNYYCKKDNLDGSTTQYVAGCVPVAVAQILTSLAYHQNFLPDLSVFIEDEVEHTIDWNKITSAISDTMKYNQNEHTQSSLEIAKLIRSIGIATNAKYGTANSSGTSVRNDSVAIFLRNIGLDIQKNQLDSLDESIAFDMLVKKNFPLYVCASRLDSNDGTRKAHAFVLDGWLRLEYTRTGGSIHQPETRQQFNLAHVNFGYEGYCDGYYITTGFDMTSTEYDNFVEEGDSPGVSMQRNYNLSIRCLPFE